jgi:hypothetical protein
MAGSDFGLMMQRPEAVATPAQIGSHISVLQADFR